MEFNKLLKSSTLISTITVANKGGRDLVYQLLVWGGGVCCHWSVKSGVYSQARTQVWSRTRVTDVQCPDNYRGAPGDLRVSKIPNTTV